MLKYISVESDNLVLISEKFDLINLNNNIYQISHEDTEENHVCCKIYNDQTEDSANKNDSNNLSSHCGKYSSNEEVLEKTVNNEKKENGTNIVVNDERKKEMNNTKKAEEDQKK